MQGWRDQPYEYTEIENGSWTSLGSVGCMMPRAASSEGSRLELLGTRHHGACSPSGPRRRLKLQTPSRQGKAENASLAVIPAASKELEARPQDSNTPKVSLACVKSAGTRTPDLGLTASLWLPAKSRLRRGFPKRPLSVWPLWWRADEFQYRYWHPIHYMFTGGGLRIAQLGARGLPTRGATSRRGPAQLCFYI